MNIRPTSTGSAPTYGPSGSKRAADEERRVVQDDAGSRPHGDQVELSDAARELASRPMGRVVGSIPHQKMRTVLARIAAGYYDRPEVRDQILDCMTPDLDPEN